MTESRATRRRVVAEGNYYAGWTSWHWIEKLVSGGQYHHGRSSQRDGGPAEGYLDIGNSERGRRIAGRGSAYRGLKGEEDLPCICANRLYTRTLLTSHLLLSWIWGQSDNQAIQGSDTRYGIRHHWHTLRNDGV